MLTDRNIVELGHLQQEHIDEIVGALNGEPVAKGILSQGMLLSSRVARLGRHDRLQ